MDINLEKEIESITTQIIEKYESEKIILFEKETPLDHFTLQFCDLYRKTSKLITASHAQGKREVDQIAPISQKHLATQGHKGQKADNGW